MDGSYNVTVDTPMGAQEGVFTIKTDGNTFSGDFTFMGNPSELSGGTIDGNNFSIKCVINSPVGAIDATIAGTIDGDTLKANASTGLGEMPINGKKA
ncbi:hypothetical protein LJC04_01505 [Ruminococcaceae bacterium OttesenSCG-928-O06]|nr:hypothetical protein [Ruminococcaceae bacterium OttesenSCG-928-O06]